MIERAKSDKMRYFNHCLALKIPEKNLTSLITDYKVYVLEVVAILKLKVDLLGVPDQENVRLR